MQAALAICSVIEVPPSNAWAGDLCAGQIDVIIVLPILSHNGFTSHFAILTQQLSLQAFTNAPAPCSHA